MFIDIPTFAYRQSALDRFSTSNKSGPHLLILINILLFAYDLDMKTEKQNFFNNRHD